ncbi:hypothetical protein GCM10011390_09130 [Aureimonas endophytica]|uniref:Uncharacterized protein n=1 Tax=Aureimonas endophytica TaxID=2027858 RepID=A0A916ZFF3_9HYPH|nr:hypothetical protein GCM10011390_09130 [Aureimonas endophytica]
MKGSPALRQELVDHCLKTSHVVGEERRMLAKVANVSANAPLEKILCTRVTNALASGRLSYSDFQSMEFGHVTPGLIRALQDR